MITVTVTGNLADDPHTFRIRDGQVGCDLRIAVDLPPRTGSDESPVRYLKAVAFGVLATHAAESLRKGDRVTVVGHDLTAEAWVTEGGDPAGRPSSAPSPRSRHRCGSTPSPPAGPSEQASATPAGQRTLRRRPSEPSWRASPADHWRGRAFPLAPATSSRSLT